MVLERLELTQFISMLKDDFADETCSFVSKNADHLLFRSHQSPDEFDMGSGTDSQTFHIDDVSGAQEIRKRRASSDDEAYNSKKRKLNETPSLSRNELETSLPITGSSNKPLPANLFLFTDDNTNDEDFEL